MLVDETFATTVQAYRLTQVHRIDRHTVRVQIHRDAYERQSHATVEVLTPHLTWTELATEPTCRWYQSTPGPYARPAATARTLHPIAERLVDRARAILGIDGSAPATSTSR